MDAGKLRHRISLDARITSQDETGDPTVTWTEYLADVPAAIEPISGREFASNNALLSQAQEKITIRWREGIVPTMRVRHGSTVYNIHGVLPDRSSGREWITLLVNRGTNEG